MAIISDFVDVDELNARSLENAFQQFCEHTERLQTAYDRLKGRVEAANLELEETNRQLNEKIQQLDEAIHFNESILHSIPSAVVVTDLEGRIKALNGAAERMWNVAGEETISSFCREVMGEGAALLEKVIADGKRREGVRRELNGREKRALISSTSDMVYDSGGNPIGAVQIDKDLTEVCILERQLMQQEKMADLGMMAADMAHEIKKPLNGIKGFASLLQGGTATSGHGERYISNIMSAAERLNDMLGELLDFARPDSITIAPCDMLAAVEEVVEFSAAEHDRAASRIQVDISTENKWVRADPAKLRQVFLNLIKNALEVTGEDGVIEISAALQSSGPAQKIKVSIRDNGPGIPEDKLQMVRRPFYSEKEGAGLGLAICERILKEHGAELEIKNGAGSGVVVEFELQPAYFMNQQ